MFTDVRSVIANSKSPERLHFHVIVTEDQSQANSLEAQMRCTNLFNSSHFQAGHVQFIHFAESLIKVPIVVHSNPSLVGKLSSLTNFARFYHDQLLHGIDKIVYMDADMVVQGDLVALWDDTPLDGKLLAAVPRPSPIYRTFFNELVLAKFLDYYRTAIDDTRDTYNAGFYIMDLKQWRERKLTEEIHYWMSENKVQRLWEFGTQPLQLIVSYKNWARIDAEWNVQGLGYNHYLQNEVFDKAKLLHWNGYAKPWLSNGLYVGRWSRYKVPTCSGRGQCELGGCICHGASSGDFCET